MTAARRSILAVAPLVALGSAVGGCLPAPATEEARAVTDLWTVFVAVATVVAAVVLGLTVFAVVRYRRRGDDEDDTPAQHHGDLRLEIAWTAIPAVIIVILFALTVVVLGRLREGVDAPTAVHLQVTAFRWGWRFEYPDAGVRVEGVREPGPEVMVPVGRPVSVELTGEDVVHAFFVPAFLFKQDAIPGQVNTFAFTVDEPGTYRGQCAEFCGVYHSGMPFTIVAVPEPEFETWLTAQGGHGDGSAAR